METDRDPSFLKRSGLKAAADFLRQYWLQVIAISAGLLIPCLWHRQIEAGDLGSHVYNALLAKLSASWGMGLGWRRRRKFWCRSAGSSSFGARLRSLLPFRGVHPGFCCRVWQC